MKGILFGSKHTWTDWNLVLKEKPDISFPEVKTNYIDLTGADGQIDLTEVFGEPKYKNRKGSLTFTKVGNRDSWNGLKSNIQNYLHGQKMRMILDEDSGYYYYGRFALNNWKSSKKTADLVIDYDLDPWKYEVISSIEPWKWDPFNFETGVIRNYASIEINGDTTVDLIGSRKPTIPTLTVNSTGKGFRVHGEYGSSGSVQWFDLPNGTYKDPEFIIREGRHTFRFQGTGTITVNFRGGSL